MAPALITAVALVAGLAHGIWRERDQATLRVFSYPASTSNASPSGPSPVWSRNTTDGLKVILYSDRSYKVLVAGSSWMESSPIALHGGGFWFCDPCIASKGHALDFITFASGSGNHFTLGPFDQVQMQYTIGTTKIPVHFSIIYYKETETFMFQQRFPSGLGQVNTSHWDPASTLKTGNNNHKAFIVATGPKDKFEVNWPHVGQFLSSGEVSVHFPSFRDGKDAQNYMLRHLTWVGRFAVSRSGDGVGGAAGQEGGPIVIYDGNAENALVLSPFDNFKSNILGYDCEAGGSVENKAKICAGTHGHVVSFPPGYSTTTSLSFSKHGPTDAVYKWGKVMQMAHGTKKMQKDPISSKLSYWTDNGAFYSWYKWEDIMKMGSPNEVLIKLSSEFAEKEIPVHYYQLDAYWFDYERENANCKLNLQEQSKLFPDGLKALAQEMKTNFLFYDGPTCAEFKPIGLAKTAESVEFIMSNPYNLSWANGQLASVHPKSVEPYFNAVMESFKEKGSIGYEVDFMDFNFLLFREYNTNVRSAHSYLKTMGDAAEKHGLPVQYCMPLPSDLLESVNHNAVTNARATNDYQVGKDNWRIAPTALLHSALGLRSSKDNFQTCVSNGAVNPELNALVAAISTGPVGFSDELGKADYDIIKRTCSKDGTLLRTSRAPHPIDKSYVANPPKGDIWTSSTTIGNYTWYHVLAVETSNESEYIKPAQVYPKPSSTAVFIAWELKEDSTCKPGMEAAKCAKEFSAIKTLNVYTGVRGKDSTNNPLKFKAWGVSPVVNGFALLGESSKFVPVSPDRIANVAHVSEGGVNLIVKGSQGEVVEMLFITPKAGVVASKCTVDASLKCNIQVTAATIATTAVPVSPSTNLAPPSATRVLTKDLRTSAKPAPPSRATDLDAPATLTAPSGFAARVAPGPPVV